jgi:hypothetical protein
MSDIGALRENEALKAEIAGLKDGGNHHQRHDDAPFISPTFMWIIGIVFMCGCAYTIIMDIPSIKKEQSTQALDINTIKANYANIEKWMEKIDRKMDRSNNVR